MVAGRFRRVSGGAAASGRSAAGSGRPGVSRAFRERCVAYAFTHFLPSGRFCALLDNTDQEKTRRFQRVSRSGRSDSNRRPLVPQARADLASRRHLRAVEPNPRPRQPARGPDFASSRHLTFPMRFQRRRPGHPASWPSYLPDLDSLSCKHHPVSEGGPAPHAVELR
jgi:hypothetical protein